MVTRLIYVHDPMCSWCWAFSPCLASLRRNLPGGLAFGRLLGGLAPDNDTPMSVDMRHYLQQTWRRIQRQVPDTRFNFDFWSQCNPRRSTYPACRAIIAARHLNPTAEDAMILAIQRAYYTQARNPSLKTTLIDLAKTAGLDPVTFGSQLDAAHTQRELLAEVNTARSLGVDSFPSLVLVRGEDHWPVPVDYREPQRMLERVNTLMT